MALTPEDVVNKRFQPTKFREGYDQDEVDDFLDEVVVELRRLNQENEELRQRLIASDSRIAELQRSGGAAAAQPAQAPAAEAVPQPAADTVAQPVAAQPVQPEAPAQTGFGATPGLDDAGSTNNLLQLARRLHEEHVREGIEKRDALIAEGHATAARVVGEAEAQQREQIGALEKERASLEAAIEELRTFESEYRQKLKSYIEDQLRELDNAGPLNAAPVNTGSASHGAGASSGAATSGGFTAPGATPPPASYQGFGGN
ncbi:MAG TPA: DivIVA domain-containing protein [Homoserinimonas sp.]|nr:DivIVA domain-containing protein [Homoserinimonas sp.]